MWRRLARIRSRRLARSDFLPGDSTGLDPAALQELRERYVSGLLPVQEFEWAVRRLARQARERVPLFGPPVVMRRGLSPAARLRRVLLAPLAVCALLATLAGGVLLAIRVGGSAEVVPPALRGEPVAPAVTPFARVTPGTGGVIAVDYFDSSDTGLLPSTSSDPAKYGRGYMDGGYALRIVDPTWHFVAQARLPGTYDDVGIAVDATLVGDVPDRYVAVSCRDGGAAELSGYRLEVEPARGAYALSRWEAGKQIALEPLQLSPAVRRGHGVNRIGLSCAGSEITATINGAVVKTLTDGTYARGRLWLGVGAYAGRNLTADARFHNLVISER